MADLAASRPASRSTLLIPFVLACAVIADRAQLSVSTGGRGALPLLAFVAPLVAILTALRYGRARSLGFLSHPIFLLGVLPYLALTLILPMLGIIFYGYPERTLLNVTGATTALSFLVVGAALSTGNAGAWTRWLVAAIVIQFAYALGQAIYQAHGPGWELFAPFHAWDLSLQGLNGVLVQARSSGLYFNPNELGLWAGIALVLGWAILPGRWRYVAVTIALLTLLLSQSRGITVALAAALSAGAVITVVEGRISLTRAMRTLAIGGGVLLVAAAVALVIGIPDAAIQRFASLLAVFTQGPQADANLAGRLDYWSAVTTLNATYPWGTLGPPELLLGTAIDSSWFQTFAQGSVPYAAALGLLLLSAFAIGEYRYRDALRVMAVLIAVAGITQTPFSYPSIFLFWVFVGAGLQSSVEARSQATWSTRWQADPLPSGPVTGMDRPLA
jgi:hypothetical protein